MIRREVSAGEGRKKKEKHSVFFRIFRQYRDTIKSLKKNGDDGERLTGTSIKKETETKTRPGPGERNDIRQEIETKTRKPWFPLSTLHR